MLALHPRTVDAVWAAVQPLIPQHRPVPHPLGCHRPRIADRVCFEGILRRLGLLVGRTDPHRPRETNGDNRTRLTSHN